MKRAMPFARKSQSGSHVISGNHITNDGRPQPPNRPLSGASAKCPWTADGPRPRRVGKPRRSAKARCLQAKEPAADRDGSRSGGASANPPALFLAIAETFLKFPKADFLALVYRGLGEVQVNPPVLETEVVVDVRDVRRTVGHPCISIAVRHLDRLRVDERIAARSRPVI